LSSELFAWDRVVLEVQRAAGNWTIAGVPTDVEAVSDDSDQSYLFIDLPNRSHRFYVSETDLNYDNGESIIAVRLWARVENYNRVRTFELYPSLNASGCATLIATLENPEWVHGLYLVNPSGAPWSWADINAIGDEGFSILVWSSSLGGANSPGGRITEVKAEILTGDFNLNEDVFLAGGPIVGGVTPYEAKVWVRLNKPGTVAIRYGLSEDAVKAGQASTTYAAAVDSSTNFSHIFTITGLSPESTYYMNVIANGKSVYEWWTTDRDGGTAQPTPWSPFYSLPKFKTAPADERAFTFAVVADRHRIDTPYFLTQIWPRIHAFSPDFLMETGDVHDEHFTNSSDSYYFLDYGRGYHWRHDRNDSQSASERIGGSGHFAKYITHHLPYIYQWSDHDYGAENDACKSGCGDMSRFAAVHENLKVYKSYFPMHDLAAPDDLEGSSTFAGDSTTLNCTGCFPTTGDSGIYPGMVAYNCTDDAFAVVTTVSTDSLTTTALTNGGTWDSGDDFLIRRGGLWRRFRWGPAEFFIIDSRYKRDYNWATNGADMLDGRYYTDSAGGMGSDRGDGTGVGHVQRDWLIRAVNGSTASWKFIFCDVPFNSFVSAPDRWGYYGGGRQEQRSYLLDNIAAENVVWITGDSHHVALDDGKTNPDTDPWPEIKPGTLGGGMQCPLRGDYYVDGVPTSSCQAADACPAFALVEVTEDRVTATIYDENGQIVTSDQPGNAALTMTLFRESTPGGDGQPDPPDDGGGRGCFISQLRPR
jgi:hypothetical protein